MTEYAHQVVGVFPTENDPCLPFAYTVGRETELIMAGPLNIQVMASLLNDLTERDDATPLRAGDRVEGVIAGGLTLAIVEVADMRKAEMFQSTGTRALQAVWPDASGNFPWDEGWEYQDDTQPVFGEV